MNQQQLLAACYQQLEHLVIKRDFSKPVSELERLLCSTQFQPLLGSLITIDEQQTQFHCNLKLNAELLILLAHVAGSFYSTTVAQKAQLIMAFIISRHHQEGGWKGQLSGDLTAIEYPTAQLAKVLDGDCLRAFTAVHFENYTINDQPQLLAEIRSFDQVSNDTGMYLKQVQYSYEQARQQLASQCHHLALANQTADQATIYQAIAALLVAAPRFNRPDIIEFSEQQLHGQLQTLNANSDPLDVLLSACTAIIYALNYQWRSDLFEHLLTTLKHILVQSSADDLNQQLTKSTLSISEIEALKALQIALQLTAPYLSTSDHFSLQALQQLINKVAQLSITQDLYLVIGDAAPARHLQQQLSAEYQADKYFVSITYQQCVQLGFADSYMTDSVIIMKPDLVTLSLIEIKKEQLISCSLSNIKV